MDERRDARAIVSISKMLLNEEIKGMLGRAQEMTHRYS